MEALKAIILGFFNPPPLPNMPGTNVLGINWDFWGPFCLIMVLVILSVIRHIASTSKDK